MQLTKRVNQMQQTINYFWSYWLRMPSWQKIFGALLLGIIVGAFAHQYTFWLKSVGVLFMNAIRLIVAPVVFTGIVTSILSLQENVSVRRITCKAISLYAVCMIISASIGCALAYLIALNKF